MAVPGARGKWDEGVRGQPVSVGGIKTQGVEVLKRQPDKVLRPKPSPLLTKNLNDIEREVSYMWVGPNCRVVVCPVNTDQTDSTWREKQIPHIFKVVKWLTAN